MTHDPEHDDGGLRVRPYALTGGRTRAATELPIETIVRTSARGALVAARLTMERKRIIVLCQVPNSIAEVSAHLRIPLGVARVLVGDMATEGLLDRHQLPTTKNNRPDVKLLERVLHGLQAL